MVAFWHRLDLWARRLIPLVVSILFVFVAVLPLPIPGFGVIMPMLALGSVFFWAVHYPSLLPPVAVFAIGLIQDVLTGALLGTGAVILLLAYGAVVSQRVFFRNKSFLVIWWSFMIVALGVGLLAWVLASLFGGRLMPTEAAIIQVLVTIAVYPLLTGVLHGVHKFVPRED
ncbi:MAG TPA: rod shape-determining protein MreD [Alphaproteobacteria bacterium]|nr:rod shape-determining protein MreD [Alphaproteobacteria bacterium]